MSLYLRIKTDNKSIKGSEAFYPLLKLLNNSFLYSPNILRVTNKKDKKISNFDSDEVLSALDRKKYAVELLFEDLKQEVLILQDDIFSSVTIVLPKNQYTLIESEKIINAFVELSRIMKSTYSGCLLEHKLDSLCESHFELYHRTFLCPGLSWLNFFGPEEELRQGGSIIEQNPYATRVERFPEGLFMQVGHGPEDCLTPEGEELLLNATKALPPAKWSLD